MDEYRKLLEPYSEDNRTIEGQVHWLIKKGFTMPQVHAAMEKVYSEIVGGRTHENGHALDQHLLATATDLMLTGLMEDLNREARLEVVKALQDKGKMKKMWMVIRGEL